MRRKRPLFALVCKNAKNPQELATGFLALPLPFFCGIVKACYFRGKRFLYLFRLFPPSLKPLR